MTKNYKTLVICLIILYLLTFARFINTIDHWPIDISSHFTFQYALTTLLILLYSIWNRYIRISIFATFLLLFNFMTLITWNESAHASIRTESTFSIYSANINKSNRELHKLIDELRKNNADIILLLEINDDNIQPLQSVIQTYPYKIESLNNNTSGTGAVIMSRFPILSHETTKYSEFGNLLITAYINIYGKQVVFYGAHFPKPTNINEFPSRSKQILSLARDISEQTTPIILAGDLNTTPYSPVFKKLIDTSKLKDSREGFGWLPSWPTYLPLFWLPIDHILVSQDIKVQNRTVGSYIGSDHYPVLAELAIN